MWSLSSQLPEPYLFTPCGIHHFLSCINYACAWPIYILLTFLKHKDTLALFHLCHPPPPVPEAVIARGPAGSPHAEPVWGNLFLAHYWRECLVFRYSKQSCSRHKARQKGKAKACFTGWDSNSTGHRTFCNHADTLLPRCPTRKPHVATEPLKYG